MASSADSFDPYGKATVDGPSTVTARPPPRVGAVVGEKYRIESVIGQGGMGAVFRARHLITERAVALKWMLPDAGGEEAVQRFLREARAMGRIDHPGVVGVLDVGVDEGATFLVMELLKGNSLREIVESRDRLEPAEAIALLMPALEGVEAAHRNGVVHRDLKPENIFVVRGGDGTIETTKVLDFGISKLRDDRLEPSPEVDLKKGGLVTRTGVTIGTPSYMSPEQVRGSKDLDARTDVWSLGVILYEMLAGAVPFRAESFGALLVAIATEGFPPLDSVRPGLPAMLVAAVHRALEKEPSVRFGTVAELATALAPFGPAGLRFRVPNLAPTAVEAKAPARPRAPVAATVLGKGPPPEPATRNLKPVTPTSPVEERELELAMPPGRASSDGDARRRADDLPSLAPIAREDARGADLAQRPAARERVERIDHDAPAPPDAMRRFVLIAASIFGVAILLAIALRVVSSQLTASEPARAITPPAQHEPEPPPSTTATSPPRAPPTAPPSTTSTTTASGTSLSPPPSVAPPPIAPPPSTPSAPPTGRGRDRDRHGTRATSPPSTTPATTPTAPPPSPTSAPSEPPPTTEPTHRTGTLTRDDF